MALALSPKSTTTPPRGLLYGVPKIGKTTFLASAPGVAFIDLEDGLKEMDYIPRVAPLTLRELQGFLDEQIGLPKLEYQTLVVDTLDALERMIYLHLCSDGKVDSIEEFGKGFKKGYIRGGEVLQGILGQLDAINKKGVAIWLCSHAGTTNVKRPDGVEYSTYGLKGHPLFNGICVGWADLVLFANFEAFQVGDKRAKFAAGGDRKLYTQNTLHWQAGNRFGLPESMEFDYAAFDAEMKSLHRPTLESKVMELLSTSTFTAEQRAKLIACIPTLTPVRLRAMVEHCAKNQPT